MTEELEFEGRGYYNETPYTTSIPPLPIVKSYNLVIGVVNRRKGKESLNQKPINKLPNS